jgi:hypothetical protein
MIEEEITDLEARGQGAVDDVEGQEEAPVNILRSDDWTYACSFGVLSSPANWRRAASLATATQLEELQAGLNSIRDRLIGRKRLDQADAARAARLERLREPLEEDDPEAVAAAALVAEANRLAEYRRSDSGRLEAIENLLVEIRDALRK